MAERRRLARERGKDLAGTVAFWFRRKYNLPPTDPRFLEMTSDAMLEEYWAHRYFDDPKAAEEFIDDDFDLDTVVKAMEEGDDWQEIANERYQDPG